MGGRTAQPTPVSAFKLLVSRRDVGLLRQLSRGRCDIAVLRAALPSESIPTLYGALERLVSGGAARRIRAKRGFTWAITLAGRRLLQIEQLAFALGRRLPVIGPAACAGRPELLLAHLSDSRTRLVLRTLCVARSARPSEIERALTGRITHRGMHERLNGLVATGVVARTREGGASHYTLADSWHAFACVLLLAAQWEWQAGQPAHPELASDLAGFVALVAPLARPPSDRQGTAVLVVDHPAALDPALRVEMRDGRLCFATPRLQPASGSSHDLVRRDADPAASAIAPPKAWCDALLEGRTDELRVTGSADLLAEVVNALSAASVKSLASNVGIDGHGSLDGGVVPSR